jgi:hypothetical protein
MVGSAPKDPERESVKTAHSSSDAKRRIETQIHRRKKAKAVLPMEAEWNEDSQSPPHLKMPADQMDKTDKGHHRSP